MKFTKISFHALVALYCSVWFLTACQEDEVGQELAPVSEEQHPETDDASTQQLLEAIADRAPSDLHHARTANADLTYQLTVNVFSLVNNGQGPLIEQQVGTLSLSEIDEAEEIPGIDVPVSENTQLYRGVFDFTDEGNTEQWSASAIFIKGSFTGSTTGSVSVQQPFPGTGFRIGDFTPGEDFASDKGFIVYTPEGKQVIVRAEATFVE